MVQEVKLVCPNEACRYVWAYKGTSQFYATCPRCHYKVNIKKKEQLSGKTVKHDDA